MRLDSSQRVMPRFSELGSLENGLSGRQPPGLHQAPTPLEPTPPRFGPAFAEILLGTHLDYVRLPGQPVVRQS